MKKAITLAAVILSAVGAFADPRDWAKRISCEIQSAGESSLPNLEFIQGSTPLISADQFRNGKSLTVTNDVQAVMRFSSSLTNTYWVSVTNQSYYSNSYLIQMPSIGTNAVNWVYTILYYKDGAIYWTGSGRLDIKKSDVTGLALNWQPITDGWAAQIATHNASTASHADKVTTNRTITINGVTGQLSSNLTFTVTGGTGINEETATNISQAVIAPYTNSIATAWQNPPSATNWTWTSDGHEVTITGYLGNDINVIIPEFIDGLPVTKIGNDVFFDKQIVSVYGGIFIKEIGERAFAYDTITPTLSSINFPSVENIKTDGFGTCSSITNVTMPSLKNIGDRAFFGISATSIYLPNVTNISSSAFGGSSLTAVYFSKDAPSAGLNIYDIIPANQVTNYVTNPTATGWGTTFGGMPVVRMPVTSTEVNAGTVISITSTTTNLTALDGITLGGTKRTTWPEGGSSTPLAWTPITTGAGGTVLTANVTTARSVYSFSTDVAVTLTNDLSAITLNFTTNYDWQVWISMNTQAALSSIATNWDARIEWLGGTPDFSCTGLYKFAMSTACGTRIQARQIYPTVYPWEPALHAGTRNLLAATLSVGNVTMLNQTDTNATCYIVRNDFQKPVLFKFHTFYNGAEAWHATNRVYARVGLGANNVGAVYPTGFPTVAIGTNASTVVNYMYIPNLVWPYPTQGYGYTLHYYRTNGLSANQRVDLGEMQWTRTANELEQVAGTNKAAWATAYQ